MKLEVQYACIETVRRAATLMLKSKKSISQGHLCFEALLR